MVDRRHRPGGHWNDAYPFVRLHQPSAFYGVNSRILGTDSIDESGPNAGFYQRASAAEICDYFGRVLEEHLVPSGQVRFFGMCDYVHGGSSEHGFVSRLTGEATNVGVRRKVVDATYLETPVPSTHTPSFDVDPEARLIPVNDLVALTEPGRGYTIIGAGKTAMDACNWLLDNGVTPAAIRWIRPRDAWILDREYQQPLKRLVSLIEGVARNLEASAQAESVDDLFRRLEAFGQLVRIDPTVEPTMYRCATASQAERESLRRVENVVRLGRVLHIGADQIVLEQGSVPTGAGQVHVDCTAAGLRLSPARPIFEADRITVQQVRTCQPTFNAALLAFLESSRDNDADKNRLCPPNPYPTAAADWMSGTLISQRAQVAWFAEPDLMAWMERARLNRARGIGDHIADPRMRSADAIRDRPARREQRTSHREPRKAPAANRLGEASHRRLWSRGGAWLGPSGRSTPLSARSIGVLQLAAGNPASAVSWLRAAVASAETSAAPPWIADTRTMLAHALGAFGDHEDSRAVAARARAEAEALGMGAVAARAAQLL